MWNKLTIQQAQQIDKLRQKAKGLTETDIDAELLAIIHKVPLSKIDSMAWLEFQEKRKELSFLLTEPGAKPLQYINIGRKRYKFVYDVRKMPFARYVESKEFSKDFVGNLHRLAATMVIPMKRTLFGRWVEQPYNADKHEEYANDMLNAPYGQIYASAVFFCNLYKNWIIVLKDSMILEQQSKGKTKEEAENLVNDLCRYLDGITQPSKLGNITESV